MEGESQPLSETPKEASVDIPKGEPARQDDKETDPDVSWMEKDMEAQVEGNPREGHITIAGRTIELGNWGDLALNYVPLKALVYMVGNDIISGTPSSGEATTCSLLQLERSICSAPDRRFAIDYATDGVDLTTRVRVFVDYEEAHKRIRSRTTVRNDARVRQGVPLVKVLVSDRVLDQWVKCATPIANTTLDLVFLILIHTQRTWKS
jgi:hypothetical protein